MRYWIKIGFTLVIMFCYQSVQAQSSKDTLIDGDAIIDIEPEFPGGWEKFYVYVASKIKYPKNFKGGKFEIECEVDTVGGLRVLKITPNYESPIHKEIIRVFETCPNFSPAYVDKKKVNYRFIIPIMLQN